MHGPPDDPATPKRRRRRRRRVPLTPEEAHRREQARERQRERRERDRDGVCTYPGRASPLLIEALIARNVDSRLMTEQGAEAASRDRKQIAADMAEIGDEWARLYLSKRQK